MITIQPEIEILSTESYEDMLRRIEKIGRVCYKSEERIGEGTAEKFIAGIIKRGHESVIEHGSITVKVTCDRGVTHEIVRHRIASYSQESTRYCNYSKDKFGNQITCIDLATGFSYDLDDENDRKKYEVWQKAMEAAEQIKDALKKSDPVILEPVMAVEVETPEEYTGFVMGDIPSRRGLIQGQEQRGNAVCISAKVPLSQMFGYATDLRSGTQGRATYTMQFDTYEPVPKNVAEEIISKAGGNA